MKPRVFALTVAVLVAAASTSRAQNLAPDSSQAAVIPDSAASSHAAVVSAIDAPTAAVRHSSPLVSLDASRAATHQGMGQAQALMFVGAAGFVAGAVIGGDG